MRASSIGYIFLLTSFVAVGKNCCRLMKKRDIKLPDKIRIILQCLALYKKTYILFIVKQEYETRYI